MSSKAEELLHRPFESFKQKRIALKALGESKKRIQHLYEAGRKRFEVLIPKLDEEIELCDALLYFEKALLKSVLQKYTTKESMAADGCTILANVGCMQFNRDAYTFQWNGDKIKFDDDDVQDVWSKVEDQFHLVNSLSVTKYGEVIPKDGSSGYTYDEYVHGEGWDVHNRVHGYENALMLWNEIFGFGYGNIPKVARGKEGSSCTTKMALVCLFHKKSLKAAYNAHIKSLAASKGSAITIQAFIQEIAPNRCDTSHCTFN